MTQAEAGELPVVERDVRIVSVARGVETKILVVVIGHRTFAQVYRRTDSCGDWGVPLHTTIDMPSAEHAIEAARLWHRANPSAIPTKEGA